jgi:hypothetical protein
MFQHTEKQVFPVNWNKKDIRVEQKEKMPRFWIKRGFSLVKMKEKGMVAIPYVSIALPDVTRCDSVLPSGW